MELISEIYEQNKILLKTHSIIQAKLLPQTQQAKQCVQQIYTQYSIGSYRTTKQLSRKQLLQLSTSARRELHNSEKKLNALSTYLSQVLHNVDMKYYRNKVLEMYSHQQCQQTEQMPQQTVAKPQDLCSDHNNTHGQDQQPTEEGQISDSDDPQQIVPQQQDPPSHQENGNEQNDQPTEEGEILNVDDPKNHTMNRTTIDYLTSYLTHK